MLIRSKFGAITLKQLRSFSAVAELGSFSLAAQKLNLSQPAITSGIKIIEDQLGVSLFDRNSRGIELTTAGRVLLENAIPILNRLEFAFDVTANSNPNAQTVRLNIGCIPSIAENVLPAVIEKFVERYPRVSVAVKVAVSTELDRQVLDAAIDLAIGMYPSISGLESRLLHDEELVLFCLKQDPLNRGVLRWEDLKNHEVLNFGFDRYIKTAINSISTAEINWSPVEYSIRSAKTVASLVRRGGIAILPKRAIPLQDHVDLTSARITEPSVVRKLYVVTQPRLMNRYEEDFVALAEAALHEDGTEAA